MKRLAAAALALLGVLELLTLAFARSGAAWRPRIVILVDIDPLRADHLSCLGYARPTTPFMDRMARAGVLFENAYSNANSTALSLSAILSGRYPPGALATRYRVPPSLPTLATLLHSYGFRTAAFTGGALASGELGFNDGFDLFDDRGNFASFFSTLPPALEYLRQAAANRTPTFLLVRSYGLHAPIHHPLGFDNLYTCGYHGIVDRIAACRCAWAVVRNNAWYGDFCRFPWQVDAFVAAGGKGVPLAPEDFARYAAVYDGALTYTDVEVGRLMHEIFRLHLEDQTLVVLDGCYGQHLGERGNIAHASDLEDVDLHVPLILWGRGLRGGQRFRRLVELVDVMPTVMDLVGLRPPSSLAGVSLAPLARGGSLARSAAPCVVAVGGGATLRDLRYRLVLRNPWGWAASYQGVSNFVRDGLYDVGSDPAEEHNLFSRPEGQGIVAAMKARLRRRLVTGGQPGAVL